LDLILTTGSDGLAEIETLEIYFLGSILPAFWGARQDRVCGVIPAPQSSEADSSKG
jgi:hypothetical protein